MLGSPKPRRLDAPIAVSLEELVPADHFSRHLEAQLDLGFVRDWTRDRYADRGRPSIDPVVFFKLQLVMFIAEIRSERKLIETASLNLAHRWYLGYALDESLPDHSSLTRIRQRLGVDIFQRFFEQVVDLCQEAGLVWGREFYFDATKVEANAGIPSLVPRFSYEAKAHLADLFAGELSNEDKQLVTVEDDLPDGIVRLPNVASDEVERANPPPWKLLEKRRLDPRRSSHRGYRRTSDFRVSPTDPDASPMRTGSGTALVTPAGVMENVPQRDLRWRACFRRKATCSYLSQWFELVFQSPRSKSPNYVERQRDYIKCKNEDSIVEAGQLPPFGSRAWPPTEGDVSSDSDACYEY